MKLTTLEWIDKAEGDFVTAQVSYRTRKRPNHDAVCFHTLFLLVLQLLRCSKWHTVVLKGKDAARAMPK